MMIVFFALAILLHPFSIIIIEAAVELDTLKFQRDEVSLSGYKSWVDMDTPAEEYDKISSRGVPMTLIMSDEFNQPNRDFRPGNDHLWTSLEMPDGVYGTLEYCSHKMASVVMDENNNGYFQIKVENADIDFTVFDAFHHPPKNITKKMYYRSAMIQSWNKFCIQGGMIEVSVQLPAAINAASQNPNQKFPKKRLPVPEEEKNYYPTWPAVWLMGNLGRALFTGSTNMMWPWSFNECTEESRKYQRISACNGNPGVGLNPFQGRGAPEIDILEGGGYYISASMQISPGFSKKYRYQKSCQTKACTKEGTYGVPGIPTSHWKKLGYTNWYRGMKYQAHDLCEADPKLKQNAKVMRDKILREGIEKAFCSNEYCPASFDLNGDLSRIPGTTDEYYGFNNRGTCMPIINDYNGDVLCDPDRVMDEDCDLNPKYDGKDPTNLFGSYKYQLDALSVNYPIHHEAYTKQLRYKIEWVTGLQGYLRWEIENQLLLEIPASAFHDVSRAPTDTVEMNPSKLMPEEPMYLIMNVALSKYFGPTPPNNVGACPPTNPVCKGFPMYMKVDYIRVWQDEDMSVGCDPVTYPTNTYIRQNYKKYINKDNPMIPVDGKAFCKQDADCRKNRIATGICRNNRCTCLYPSMFSGPRCITSVEGDDIDHRWTNNKSRNPPFYISVFLASVVIFINLAIPLARRWKDRNVQLKTAEVGPIKVQPLNSNYIDSMG